MTSSISLDHAPQKYDAIFFSPHLDDAALSCGGLISSLSKKRKTVLVVTVFTRCGQNPPISAAAKDLISSSGHTSATTLFKNRKKEDRKANRILDSDVLHLKYIDGLFRHHDAKLLYQNVKDLFGGSLSPHDLLLFDYLRRDITQIARNYLQENGSIFFPLGLGRHVDHVLLNRVGNTLFGIYDTLFWEDYPYLLHTTPQIELITVRSTHTANHFNIFRSLTEKQTAIEQYKSQLKSLFSSRINYLDFTETYYQRRDQDKRKPNLFFITDEISGGASIVNRNVICELYKLDPRLTTYTQVPPRVHGPIKGTVQTFWSIIHFAKYLVKIPSRSTVITTSPLALFAYKFFLINKKTRLRFIYHCNGDRTVLSRKALRHIGLAGFLYNSVYLAILHGIENISINQASKIITLSLAFKKYLAKRYSSNFKTNKIHNVGIGVDNKYYLPANPKEKILNKKSLDIKPGTTVITYSGRLDPLKGIDSLIAGIHHSQISNYIFIAMTLLLSPKDYIYKKLLIKLAHSYKTRIKFVHPTTDEEKLNIYQASDLVMLPSLIESGPLVMYESIASGTIFMGTPAGSIPQILNKISSKLIIKDHSPKSIGTAIRWYCSLDIKEKHTLVQRGIKLMKKYSWRQVALNIYKHL